MEKKLSEIEARGMTVNERLFHIGLIDEFYEAEERRDEHTMREILEKVYLTPENIEAIVIGSRKKR